MKTNLPAHFMLTESGDLFDTRPANWASLPALRPGYATGNQAIKTAADLKACLRHGPHAWPGGYPLYFICSDGEALSFDACRANVGNVLDSILKDCRDGWRVVAMDVNWEDSDLTCSHTGKRIESAYGEDSE